MLEESPPPLQNLGEEGPPKKNLKNGEVILIGKKLPLPNLGRRYVLPKIWDLPPKFGGARFEAEKKCSLNLGGQYLSPDI